MKRATERRWILLATFAGLAALAASALSRRETPSRAASWPVNFAHRGASASFPENTHSAFEAGLAAGAGGLELDVHMIRDGEIVVVHDDTVDRTTDGFGAVTDMTLAEIRSFDAGYRFSPDGLEHPRRGRGDRIPTLAEVLRRFPEAYVNAEIKEERSGIEEAVLRVIEDAGAAERTLIASWSHGVVRRFRRLAGGRVPTAASRREIRTFFLLSNLRLERLLRPAYAALQVPISHRRIPILTRRFVRAAHSRGARVDAWTINEPEEMRRLLDLGVDVIMTDRPDALADVLDERRDG